MTIIVTEGRFEGEHRSYVPFEQVSDLANASGNLAVPSNLDPALLTPFVNNFDAICVEFPSSADGRGNSIAKALRRAGFEGALRARGHVLADQYPLAVRNGFDDVEISDVLAVRAPEWQWADGYTRITKNYQNRLRA